MEQYDLKDSGTPCSMIRKGTRSNREDVIHGVRFIGFSRVTDTR